MATYSQLNVMERSTVAYVSAVRNTPRGVVWRSSTKYKMAKDAICNHHTGSPNVQFVQVVDVRTGLPHVLVVALADIREGKEATLDYGPDYFPNLVVSRIDACMQQAAWW